MARPASLGLEPPRATPRGCRFARRRFAPAGTFSLNSPSAPSQMFSSTVCAGTTRTSWNTVATTPAWPELLEAAAPDSGTPPNSMVPLSARCTPFKDLDQRALPRAVLAQQRVHLTDPELKRARTQRLGGAEGLGNLIHPECQWQLVSHHCWSPLRRASPTGYDPSLLLVMVFGWVLGC